jgi:hypothetical protein
MKVLSERTSGLLSLFGFRQVKVRIVEKARRLERRERTDRTAKNTIDPLIPWNIAGAGRKAVGTIGAKTKNRRHPTSASGRAALRKDGPPIARTNGGAAQKTGRVLPVENKSDKNRDRKISTPSLRENRSGPKPPAQENPPSSVKEGSGEPKRPAFGPVGSFPSAGPTGNLVGPMEIAFGMGRPGLGHETRGKPSAPVRSKRPTANGWRATADARWKPLNICSTWCPRAAIERNRGCLSAWPDSRPPKSPAWWTRPSSPRFRCGERQKFFTWTPCRPDNEGRSSNPDPPSRRGNRIGRRGLRPPRGGQTEREKIVGLC